MSEPKIIYEDKNFLAVNKPAGLLVHRAGNPKSEILNSKEKTLADWLLERYPEIKTVGDDPETRPGIVHRLDRDTSGVMLVARNQKYFEYLKLFFQTRKIQKTYLALVSGWPEEERGEINKPISIKSGTVKRTVHEGRLEKAAITEYKVLRRGEKEGEKLALLEVCPKTGRTHQIRVHLASIGHPVVGDRLYGRRQILNPSAKGGSASGGKSYILNSRLMLHALALEFTTTEGKRIKIEAEPPAEMMLEAGDLK